MTGRRGVQLIVAAVIAVLLLQVLVSLPFEYNRVDDYSTRFTAVTLDDAWIHFVYARSLSRGQGFSYNPGQPESGTTSPLWCALIAPFLWFGISPCTASKILGILAASALALLLGRMASRLMSRPFGILAAGLVIFDPLFGFARLSGMEVMLASALIVAAVERLLAGRSRSASVLAGLAVWARPDSIMLAVLAVVLLLAAWLDGRGRGKSGRQVSWRDALIVAAGPAIAAAAWAGYCYWATGRWLPTTYYIRGQGIAQQLMNLETAKIVLRELQDGSPMFSGAWKLVWAGIGGVALLISAFTGSRKRDWMRAVLVLLPAAYLLLLGGRVINLIGGSFTGNRYVIPVFPFMILWAMYPLYLLSEWAAKRLKPNRAPAVGWIAALAVAVGLAMTPGHTLQRYRELQHEFTMSALNLEGLHIDIARWINLNAGGDAVLALYDAGAIKYLTDRETIDIGGLNNTRYEIYDESVMDEDPARLERFCSELESMADMLIIYPNHYPTLAERYREGEVYRAVVDQPVISLGDTLIVYDLGQTDQPK